MTTTVLESHPINELKVRAEILHHRVARAEPAALERLRALRELRKATVPELATKAPEIKRKHCLAVVARESGFEDWPHATAVLDGDAAVDFGRLLCLHGSAAHWNIWSASYDEALTIWREHGGYLLAYKRQFFITDRYYIETLGLDPDDPDWELMDRNWPNPRAPEARRRLYGKLLAQTRGT